MQYLKTYLKTISSRGNEKLAESISHTAEDAGTVTSRAFHFAVMRLDCFSEMFNLGKQVRCLVSCAKLPI